jgi:hypothetical protein
MKGLIGGFWGNRRSGMFGNRIFASDTRRGRLGQVSDQGTDHGILGAIPRLWSPVQERPRRTRNFSSIPLLACKRRIPWLRNSILRRMTGMLPTPVKPHWQTGTSTRNSRLGSSIAFRPPIPSARRSRRPQNMMATARSRRCGTGLCRFFDRFDDDSLVRSRRKCLAAKRQFKTRHADHVGYRFGGGRRDSSLVFDEMVRFAHVDLRAQA